MAKIKFITDSAADIPKSYASAKNVDVLPFHIYFRDNKIDQNQYLDGIDIDLDTLYETVKKGGGSPNSSQVTAFEIDNHLRTLVAKNEYDTYIFTTISSTGSPVYNNIISVIDGIKKDGIEFDIRVIDSQHYTVCYYFAIKGGIEAYEAGANADEIHDIIKRRAQSTNIYLVAESLEYLKRGGRIKGASAALGTLLDIKPILNVHEGLVNPYDKIRGMKKALNRIIEIVKKETESGGYMYSIVYSTETESLAAFVEMVKEEFPDSPIFYQRVGTTIGVHIGPGLIGLMFQKDLKY